MITVLRTNFKLQAVKNCERPYRRYGSLLRTVPQVPLVGQATGNQHHAVDWPLIPGSSEEANHRPQLPKMLLSKVAMELFSLLVGPRDRPMSTILNPDTSMSKGFIERWELDFDPRWVDVKNQPPDTGIKDRTSLVRHLTCPLSDVGGVIPSADGDSPTHPSLMKKPPSVSPLGGNQQKGWAHPDILPSSIGDRKEESSHAKNPPSDGNESDHLASSFLNTGEEISRSREGMRGGGDEKSEKTLEQHQSTSEGDVSESPESPSHHLDEVHEEISRSQEGMRGEGDEESEKTIEQHQSTSEGNVFESPEAPSHPLDVVQLQVVGVDVGEDSQGDIEEEKIFLRGENVLEYQEEMKAANNQQDEAKGGESLFEVEEEQLVNYQAPTLTLDVQDNPNGRAVETPLPLEQDPQELAEEVDNGQSASNQGAEEQLLLQENQETSQTKGLLSEEEDSYEVEGACCSSVVKPDGAWRNELVEPVDKKCPELQELLQSSTEKKEKPQEKKAPVQQLSMDTPSPIASNDGALSSTAELDGATGHTAASSDPLEAQTEEEKNLEVSEVEQSTSHVAGQTAASPNPMVAQKDEEKSLELGEDEQNTFHDVMGRVQAMRETDSELNGDSEPQWMQAMGLEQVAAAGQSQAPPSPRQPINGPKRKQSPLYDEQVFYKKSKRPPSAFHFAGPGKSLLPPPMPAECAFIPVLAESDLERVKTSRGKPIILGSGAYGDVHLMRRKSDGLLVALKRLKDVKNQMKAYKVMLSEIRPMVAMHHHEQFPKFIGIVDQTTFATEFIGDPVTKTSINLVAAVMGPFNLTKLDWTRISLQISHGLQALHAAGWIHCDLHGGNIMVVHDPISNRWSAKIIDLGSAVRIDTPPPLTSYNDKEKWYCRTLCPQIAPEIIEGFPMSIETDIYSMGALLVSSKEAAQKDELAEIYEIGVRCAVDDPNDRPSLPEIINELEALYQNVVEGESPDEQSLSCDSRSPEQA
ncbi:uncharacterized protein LOC117287981 [Asterias rubens]|uniref:uncharacterized protein LOC117287981 n=1 Tax=Asterias rubens TaxID=7604 RepID=UPI00145524B2|nr:uncharacterized protein LOC117287981 [Asterias rubens]